MLNKNVVLTKDESVALYSYTNVYPPFYEALNSELRCSVEENQLIPLIDSALRKLPIYSGEFVYRCSCPLAEEIATLAEGGIVVDRGYLSTLKRFHRIDMIFEIDYEMKIMHFNGRDISLYSDDFSSKIQEVLLPRGSSFKQVSIEENLGTIVLEQVS